MACKGHIGKSNTAVPQSLRADSASLLLMSLLSYVSGGTDIRAVTDGIASRFDPVAECFFAEKNTLLKTDGMTYDAAALIKLIGHIHTLCTNVNLIVVPNLYFEEVFRMLAEEAKEETVWALSLDEMDFAIIAERLAEGEAARAKVDAGDVTLFAGRHAARRVVFAHYHPNQKKPGLSKQDMLAMQYIGDFLETVGITLIGQSVITKRGSKFFRYAFD